MKHPQADVLIAIANGEKIQYQATSGLWIDSPPDVALGCMAQRWHVRIKPKIISINGHEVPEPVREPLEIGREYWATTPSNDEFVVIWRWANDPLDQLLLKRGLVHVTKEAAVAHARALLSFTEVKK